MIVFSLLYGILSFQSAYYGKMITYVGMRAPMALITLISWLRHPFEKGKSEVQIEMLGRKQIVLISSLSFGTTVIFYWILRRFIQPILDGARFRSLRVLWRSCLPFGGALIMR